jgi:hypothetical protein
MAIGRLRYAVITMAVVMIAGFAVFGAQVWRLNSGIDQLAAKEDGNDAASGVKFDQTNANLETISQRLAAQLNTIEAGIAAIAKSNTASAGAALSAPAPAQPPKPTSPPPTKARP